MWSITPVQWFSFVDEVLVSHFLYKLHRWFSTFVYYYTSNFLALYSLMFWVSQSSVLKTVIWPKMVYFYKLRLGWESCLIGTHTTFLYLITPDVQLYIPGHFLQVHLLYMVWSDGHLVWSDGHLLGLQQLHPLEL